MQATTTRHRSERREGKARRPPVPALLACIAIVLAAVPAHAAGSPPHQRRGASHAGGALAPPRAAAGRWTHRPAVSTGHEKRYGATSFEDTKADASRSLATHRRALPPPRKREQALRWMRKMDVPVAPGVRFHLGGHNYGGTLGETSAYDPERNRVLWKGPLVSRQDRRYLYHELGHAFDYRLANDADRERIRRLIAPRNADPWRWGKQNPAKPGREPFEERFADVYSYLALSRKGWPRLRTLLAEVAARGSADA